jgi:hypothetical protein
MDVKELNAVLSDGGVIEKSELTALTPEQAAPLKNEDEQLGREAEAKAPRGHILPEVAQNEVEVCRIAGSCDNLHRIVCLSNSMDWCVDAARSGLSGLQILRAHTCGSARGEGHLS